MAVAIYKLTVTIQAKDHCYARTWLVVIFHPTEGRLSWPELLLHMKMALVSNNWAQCRHNETEELKGRLRED